MNWNQDYEPIMKSGRITNTSRRVLNLNILHFTIFNKSYLIIDVCWWHLLPRNHWNQQFSRELKIFVSESWNFWIFWKIQVSSFSFFIGNILHTRLVWETALTRLPHCPYDIDLDDGNSLCWWQVSLTDWKNWPPIFENRSRASKSRIINKSSTYCCHQ